MSQQMNRKDQHVALANEQYQVQAMSDFDQVRFVHQSLPQIDLADVSLKTRFAGLDLDYPFYINGMTGGSEKTAIINQQLAEVAKATGIAMATGSVSAALKHPETAASYQIVREVNPDGLVFANLGAEHSVENGKKAVALLKADAIQIHVNAPQEMIMPEGSREFSTWLDSIKAMVEGVGVPVIVKEVGFGMSRDTISQLSSIGVKTIDISGRGGTNFATIENARRPEQELDLLANWGQSTAISLIEAYNFSMTHDILASGGIRNPLDMAKALALGAKACGLSGQILELVQKQGVEETIKIVNSWKDQLQTIMTLLGCRKVSDLKQTDLVLTGSVKDWCDVRDLNYRKFANR
ncbi:type 2 isopentenyl-diphosphate Delta-isomerase [Vagococcus coleopterorum]|nr:type 2 isopentenyl-diphosphate Delta-isomerase [Vagococcus coleopterorum]